MRWILLTRFWGWQKLKKYITEICVGNVMILNFTILQIFNPLYPTVNGMAYPNH